MLGIIWKTKISGSASSTHWSLGIETDYNDNIEGLLELSLNGEKEVFRYIQNDSVLPIAHFSTITKMKLRKWNFICSTKRFFFIPTVLFSQVSKARFPVALLGHIRSNFLDSTVNVNQILMSNNYRRIKRSTGVLSVSKSMTFGIWIYLCLRLSISNGKPKNKISLYSLWPTLSTLFPLFEINHLIKKVKNQDVLWLKISFSLSCFVVLYV